MPEALLQAIKNQCHIEAMQLIADGANINYQNPNRKTNGYTPLIQAALNIDINMMLFLLENQAEVDKEDHEGMTALDHVYTNYYDKEEYILPVIELLHQHNANLMHENPNGMGETVFQWAAYNGHKAIVEFLLETAKLDPCFAIDDALEGRHDDMIDLLQKAIREWENSSEVREQEDAELSPGPSP